MIHLRKRLAYYFWELSGEPIANALFAVRLLDKMERLPALQHGHLKNIREEMIDFRVTFEGKAVGVLEECYKELPQKAFEILRTPLRHLGMSNTTCLHLAAHAHCLNFLNSRACQSAVERQWFNVSDRYVQEFAFVRTTLLNMHSRSTPQRSCVLRKRHRANMID